MENTSIVYRYFNPLTFEWSGNEITTAGFRQEIDWGDANLRNRVGVYLISDPENEYNIRFFFDERESMPVGATGSINTNEPIIEEVDSNNRSRRLFFIGPGTKIYAEPQIWQGASGVALDPGLRLYVYQVAGTPVKYFGL
jgi:hypothetical protein